MTILKFFFKIENLQELIAIKKLNNINQLHWPWFSKFYVKESIALMSSLYFSLARMSNVAKFLYSIPFIS